MEFVRAKMTATESETRIRKAVRNSYASRASRSTAECGCSCCSTEIETTNEAESLRAGCGHPVSGTTVKEGEVVLDLGSGAGADVFQAAKLVGPSGRVIGVDATPEMIWKARDLATKDKVGNVEFRLGEIEHLPVESDSIDIAVSNCVLNLLPDKRVGFQEIFRVLKRGGRIRVSDLVTSNPVPRNQVRPEAWASCVEGAIPEKDYSQLLTEAGFRDVHLVDEEDCSGCCDQNSQLRSVQISAVKPT
jgi:SAM-dependent methyltransferase